MGIHARRGWVRQLSGVVALSLSCAALGAGSTPAGRGRGRGRNRVVVVGGGIGGLIAAYELERRGLTVHLLEASSRYGGRVGTARYGDGLSAEYGMQEIWSKSPLAALARSLGLTLEGEGAAFSSVVLDGTLHAFTQDTAAQYLESIFSEDERAAFVRFTRRAEQLHRELHEEGMTPDLAPLNDLSFAAWLQKERLPPRVVAFLRLTLECELGADADSFSALSGLDELRVFLFGQEAALHVEGGNSRLVEALAARIRGPKTLGARVYAVRRERDASGRLAVHVSYMLGQTSKTVSADRVVIAVPWTVLHTIQLDPPLPGAVASSLGSLGRGQYTVVHLIVDKRIHALWGGPERAPFPVLTPGPLGVIYGVSERSPEAQPREVFSLLVHGNAARAFHMVPHEQKRRELVAGLDALWPGFAKFVIEAAVYPYHPAAIPFWPPGRSPHDAQARSLFQDFEGLRLVGDYLVSSHSEGAVVSAQRQADAIARELHGSAAAPGVKP